MGKDGWPSVGSEEQRWEQAGLSFRNYGETEVLECCASQDRRADAWLRRHVSDCTCPVVAPIAGRAVHLAN